METLSSGVPFRTWKYSSKDVYLATIEVLDLRGSDETPWRGEPGSDFDEGYFDDDMKGF